MNKNRENRILQKTKEKQIEKSKVGDMMRRLDNHIAYMFGFKNGKLKRGRK